MDGGQLAPCGGPGQPIGTLCHQHGARVARQARCPALWQRQDSHGGYALLQEEFAIKPLPAEKTRIVAKIPQGAGVETGRIETDASCHPTVRLRLPIFNTENTKNPRRITEKNGYCASREAPETIGPYHWAAKRLPPPISVHLRVSFVFSVLKIGQRNSTGGKRFALVEDAHGHCVPAPAALHPGQFSPRRRRDEDSRQVFHQAAQHRRATS
jgi:hypothetical protein